MAEGSEGLLGIVDRIGELGVGVLVALENLFPPIPSEVILPFAGFRAERGELDLILAWTAATVGALVGALVLYAVGAGVGSERLHELAGKRWFVILSQKDYERGERVFERHGAKFVLLGRCVPLVRSVVSIPAGVARMPLARFCAYTLAGSAVWNALFIGAGYQLGQNYERVEGWVSPIAYAVLAAFVVWVAWLTSRKIRRLRATRAQV
ncbi:MAG: DedA family protein [Actinomycetota bacterium]|jgi:membrane protein DedA with SNARE-associated domain|nr:DedA family protein [Actinomycetota bacterium]